MNTWVCSKWNQHPTNEEKWEVTDEDCIDYCARNAAGSIRTLPKSDYRVCEPPERWVDVTSECGIDTEFGQLQHDHVSRFVHSEWGRGYRLRKELLYKAKPDSMQNCTQWAFIVEKREDV